MVFECNGESFTCRIKRVSEYILHGASEASGIVSMGCPGQSGKGAGSSNCITSIQCIGDRVSERS
jgi:hypothetical protein